MRSKLTFRRGMTSGSFLDYLAVFHPPWDRLKVEASGHPLLRVAILVAEAADRQTDYMVDLKHELIRAGHAAFFTPWFMPDYGMNVASIISSLRRTEADA